MYQQSIGEIFEGAAAKHLKAVDVDRSRSNQHEIGGLAQAGFKQFLGEPPKGEVHRFPARMIFIDETADQQTELIEDVVTWYDCRHSQPERSPEYRLYYRKNEVTELLSEGDFFLIAKCRDGSVLLVFCKAETTSELQLRQLFGLGEISSVFSAADLRHANLVLPLRQLLESLGISTVRDDAASSAWLERLIAYFGGTGFPGTREFSMYARGTLEAEIDPIQDPDGALMAWMEHEERLFRIYEGHIVKQQLHCGFGSRGDDVDEFIQFSLSVQNRRKSRVGHAFESHIDYLLRLHKLQFEQGKGKGRVTENNARPDFIFPSFASYHDPSFPVQKLRMLGAKTTCKDRWRQVLAEAQKIPEKHLITMEAAISAQQTSEMHAQNLRLVVPASIHSTYRAEQTATLMTLGEFLVLISKIQRSA